MFLHSAWIFHPEPRVAPINSTEPPVTSICSALLASTQGLTGACRRAAAPPLTAKTAIFHRAVSGVTGSLSQAPHTSFLFLLRASGWTYHKAQAEQTWRLCYRATPKGYQLQMILWHLLQMDACCQSWPIMNVCVGVGWDGMVLAPWQECGSLGNLQAGLATNKLFNTGLLNVTQIASEVTDKCRYSLLRIVSPEQVDAELRELCLISSIVPECKLNVVLGEIQYFIRCTFMEDKQYFPYSMSHSGASLPPSLSLSFSRTLSLSIFQTELNYSSVSLCSHKAGDGRAPPIPLCQTTKAASCFENFSHHANWQRHAFQKPTANLLIIIYLQRPSGCESCKNHTWYVCSLSC